MNECEYCGKDFPDITELYKHKYNTHQRSLVLHSHLQPKKESMDVVPYESTKEVVPFDLDNINLLDHLYLHLIALDHDYAFPIDCFFCFIRLLY